MYAITLLKIVMTIFDSNDHMMLLLLGSKTWRGMPRRSRPGWDGRMDKKEVDGPAVDSAIDR